MNNQWKKIKGEDHFLEMKDEDGWNHATIKWDGCIHFRQFHNEPCNEDGTYSGKFPQIVDYIHICDIDEQIKLLQNLKQMAIEHFGSDWK